MILALPSPCSLFAVPWRSLLFFYFYFYFSCGLSHDMCEWCFATLIQRIRCLVDRLIFWERGVNWERAMGYEGCVDGDVWWCFAEVVVDMYMTWREIWYFQHRLIVLIRILDSSWYPSWGGMALLTESEKKFVLIDYLASLVSFNINITHTR